MSRISVARASAVALALATAAPARAIPAFARKYGTSCLTCHTVYPKLTPFGEAFRRDGYRFPGVDSDYVKQEAVALGQEANKKTFPNAVWPGTIPASVPLAVGANGAARIYPDKGASVPRANNGTVFTLDDLVAEGQLWVGAALDDTITLFAEFSFSGGGADVEHAQVFFNDLVGPKHAVNLVVGKGPSTLSSFGPHSTYLGDMAITAAPVAGIYGLAEEPFVVGGHFTGLEVNGVIQGRFDYSLGLNAGSNSFSSFFASESWYAHAGYKIGGMRLDGEGSTGATDALHPWAERALTIDGFVYHSNEHFPSPADPDLAANDVSFTAGGGVRGQLGSLEVNVGYYHQNHNHGSALLGEVKADVVYGELSYVVYPWMVPALRVENIHLSPSGGTGVSDLHFMPGIAFLIRPNLRVVVLANIESANGFPSDAGGGPLPWQGGAGDLGSFVIAPTPAATASTTATEFSSMALLLAWAI